MSVFEEIFGKRLSRDEIMSEAMEIAGQNPSQSIILAVIIRKVFKEIDGLQENVVSQINKNLVEENKYLREQINMLCNQKY